MFDALVAEVAGRADRVEDISNNLREIAYERVRMGTDGMKIAVSSGSHLELGRRSVRGASGLNSSRAAAPCPIISSRSETRQCHRRQSRMIVADVDVGERGTWLC